MRIVFMLNGILQKMPRTQINVHALDCNSFILFASARHKYFELLKIHNSHAHTVINWSQFNAAKKKLNENISQMMQTMLYTKCAHPFAAFRHNGIDTL